jgi:ATP-dependent 26S proteasome regulatory subunit
VADWETFADVLLAREAALCRLASGVPPRDLAGLVVDDAEVDALLRTLPGLDGPTAEATERVRALFESPVEAARSRLAAWLESGRDALAATARTARLDLISAEVLALVTAVEVDPQRQRLVGYVQDSVQLPRLTLAGLARVLGPDHVRAVAPGSRLASAALVHVDDVGPWAVRMCGSPARLVWAVLGTSCFDPDLPAGTYRRGTASQRGAAVRGASDHGGRHGLVLVHGADAESRRCAAVAHLGDKSALVTRPPATREGWAAVVREATIAGDAVLLEVTGSLDPEGRDWVERADHLAVVLSSPGELSLESLPNRSATEIRVTDGEADEDDWRVHLGSAAGVPRPRLSREQLRLAARAAGRDPRRIEEGVRRLAGGHLDGLAVRIRPQRRWDDLVLPQRQGGQLRELVARYRRRRTVFGEWGFPASPSRGIVTLFAGPSGTGKTLAAEVAAAELGLDLYKVDLSAVVSKYIGETEKNLARVFGAAASGDMVLFFDEADALFGKRSEVTNAHDRYANIEVAFLLQRLEAFDGLVVLATNLQRNIDEAFLRRIGIAVTFAAPDEQERRRIWRLVFPPQAPVEDLDVDFLARQFTITGGTIRNAALGAAFMAADKGTTITMDEVVLAIQREFAKLGHLSTETEFERYFDVIRSGR